MKTALNLSFEDGRTIAEKFVEVAQKNNHIDVYSMVVEYAAAFDAAMETLGIDLTIEGAPTQDDEEEEENPCETCFSYGDCDPECEFRDSYDPPVANYEEDEPVEISARNQFIIDYIKYGYEAEEAIQAANILFGEGE